MQEESSVRLRLDDDLPLPSGVGKRVRYVRRELKGWSQQQLSEETARVGYPVAKHTINRIEGGRKPDLWEVLAITLAMNVTPEQIGVSLSDYPEVKLIQSDKALRALVTRMKRKGKTLVTAA